MKFGKYILRKIIAIVAIRRHILKLKCTKFDFGWNSAPDPAGELTVLPTPKLDLRGSSSKRREGGRKGGKGQEGEGKVRHGRDGR